MTSVGAKLRARREARRTVVIRSDAPREPNGRLSRRKAHKADRQAKTEKEAMRTAVEARMRLFGLSEKEAREQEGGTVIGRLYQSGELTYGQKEAAITYADYQNAYQRAIDVKPETGRPPAAPIFERGSDFEAFCRTARLRWEGGTDEKGRRHKGVMDVLQEVMQEHRSPAPVAALREMVIRDTFVPELLGDLRFALNSLMRHFKISA